jgi:gas vesicle protein
MPRKNSFDFPHTCPKIDKAIDSCKDKLENYLIDYIGEICSYIPHDKICEIAKKWSIEMYDGIADCFESVRQTNEQMREEANIQIANLENDIEKLNDEVKYLENRLLH